MKTLKTTEMAHDLVSRVVRPGDAVVDATVGNGHDTVFLAALVGPDGTVTGFDVQREAIDLAKARLEAEGLAAAVALHCCGHERMEAFLQKPVRAVMFNLGYLPGGDKGLVTRPSDTVAALEQAAAILQPGGVITVVVYTGHEGGPEESEAVRAFCAGLDETAFKVTRRGAATEAESAPFLLAIAKLP